MGQYQDVFKRVEKKYLLSEYQYKELRKKLEEYVRVDKYGKTTITNIYFDTPDMLLIRRSLEKPVYKEKLRLRTYGVPGAETPAFIELKKKYKGVVYKRRIDMPYEDAVKYLYKGVHPEKTTQITKEIDYFLKFYRGIAPAMYISYDRIATYGIEDPNLRITFDGNITWRTQELELSKGVWGSKLLNEGERLMEIKIGGAMPLWLVKILDELEIYPTSFSKYGNAYKVLMGAGMETERKIGGNNCA